MTLVQEPAIALCDLSKRFDKFIAVDRVTLTIPKGVIFGLLGPNGAGKTTLIRMLLGVLTPDSGTGTVLGFDIVRRAAQIRKLAGYVSQRFSLYNDLTAEENLVFYGGVYGLDGDALVERRDELLEWTGLYSRRKEPAGHLSGGWRRRLAFACAIVHRPPLLLLDEPTGGVDPISRRRFWKFLYDLAAQGSSILVTTHYMDEAEHCDLVGLMLGGKLVAQGRPAALKADLHLPTLEEVFVTLASGRK
ncbi:MAG TPA: ABC transporter ATP-binding protein [Symbiobacteriaceae bacterium]|jgi:ABC-2 type transport system ATP-binding protein